MINVVVPMAGEGSRFREKGFSTAKPFIEFCGKTMIEHVLDGLKIKGASYTLVIRENFLFDYKTELNRLASIYGVNYGVVYNRTNGALCTALSVYDKIDLSAPTIFADSDNIYKNGVFAKFVEKSLSMDMDANIMVFTSASDKFSYARIDENGVVFDIAEKKVISNNALTGSYMFSKGETFVKSAIETIIYPKRENEYYMSLAFDTLLKRRCRVGAYHISECDFACVGTPEQLTSYLSNKESV